MVGFALDDSGDIIVENGKIKMCRDNELLRQTCEAVVSTNKGEWFLNENEGINHKNIITKNPDEEVVKGEILMGLKQVRDDFKFDEYKSVLDTENRVLNINFTASSEGEKIQSNYRIEVV